MGRWGSWRLCVGQPERIKMTDRYQPHPPVLQASTTPDVTCGDVCEVGSCEYVNCAMPPAPAHRRRCDGGRSSRGGLRHERICFRAAVRCVAAASKPRRCASRCSPRRRPDARDCDANARGRRILPCRSLSARSRLLSTHARPPDGSTSTTSTAPAPSPPSRRPSTCRAGPPPPPSVSRAAARSTSRVSLWAARLASAPIIPRRRRRFACRVSRLYLKSYSNLSSASPSRRWSSPSARPPRWRG